MTRNKSELGLQMIMDLEEKKENTIHQIIYVLHFE